MRYEDQLSQELQTMSDHMAHLTDQMIETSHDPTLISALTEVQDGLLRVDQIFSTIHQLEANG